MKLFLVLFLVLFFGSGLFSNALAESSEVLISEFAAVTNGTSTDPDWIEIYNTSNDTIPVDGWYIKDSTESNKISLTGCIKPKSFRKLDFSNRLNSDTDQMRLFDASSTLVESINYFSESIPKHEKGQSTERNLDIENWKLNPSPSPTNTTCSKSLPSVSTLSVSLSEIYPTPKKDAKEWVEVYNGNSTTADLNGWYMVDAVNHKKSLSGTVGAKKYIVFYFSSGWLNNDGDTVSLFNPSGKLLEEYTFGEGSSDRSFSKEASGKWKPTTTPTPGTVNKITGPMSLGTAVSPSSTNSSPEPSVVSATGLEQTVDYLSDSLQFENPINPSSNKDSGKVAGISKGSTKSSISTLLISTGLAFIATAVAWPFLEKYKII